MPESSVVGGRDSQVKAEDEMDFDEAEFEQHMKSNLKNHTEETEDPQFLDKEASEKQEGEQYSIILKVPSDG